MRYQEPAYVNWTKMTLVPSNQVSASYRARHVSHRMERMRVGAAQPSHVVLDIESGELHVGEMVYDLSEVKLQGSRLTWQGLRVIVGYLSQRIESHDERRRSTTERSARSMHAMKLIMEALEIDDDGLPWRETAQ